jgi:serine/threonine protein kinase
VQGLRLEDTLTQALAGQVLRALEQPSPIVESLMERVRSLCPTPSKHDAMTASVEVGPAFDARAEAMEMLAAPQKTEEIGRLGPYRVLDVLGAGGMGVVFRAEDPALRRPVALKVMRRRLAASSAARQRFLREARAAAAVKHPHVVTLYHVGEDRATPFLAMELLEGETLETRLRRQGPLPLGEVLRIGREAAQGLAAAHERGLIHRDVKPSNVWLEGPESHVKLLDFGLALNAAEPAHLTSSGTLLGTPAYMAPEQAGGGAVDARADLFALGCVLYRLATGQLPFSGSQPMEILFALANVEPRPPGEVNEHIPVELSELILRLLAKDPAGRPESAGAVATRLGELEKQSAPAGPVTSRQEQSQSSRTMSPRRGRGRRLLAAAAIVLLVSGSWFALDQLLFRTPQGTLVVQINDPKVEARFKEGVLRLYGADGQLRYTLKPSERNKTLPAGPYKIAVAGADGLRLDTEEFTLEQGGKRTVRVLLSGPRQPTVDRDRLVAEWVLRSGGQVHVEDGQGKVTVVYQPATLPKGALKLRALAIADRKDVTDASLVRLRELPSLKEISLINTGISDEGLEHIKSLKTLETLWLGGSPISDAGLKAIRELLALQALSIQSVAVTDDGLQHLRAFKKLTGLKINCANVTDAGLWHIRFLKGLSSLHIQCAGVTDAGLENLSGLDELSFLALECPRINGSGFKYLAGLKKLRTLHSAQTPINDAALAHLGGLDLWSLAFAEANVTDAGLQHIANLKELRELTLWDMKITGSGFKSLAKVHWLAHLSLVGTRVDDTGVAALTALGLHTLDLSRTRVTDACVEHLKKMKRLRRLSLGSTKVSAAAVADLRTALPKCSILTE